MQRPVVDRTTLGPPRRRRAPFVLKPWMVIGLILLAAAVALLVVALSGPDLPNGPPADGVHQGSGN